jgi:hypothetical protein
MNEAPLQTIERINSRLASQLQEARRSLCGGREFAVDNVRQLRATLAEIAPLVAQSNVLCETHPEVAVSLQLYKSQLRELQALLFQIRIVLQTRQAAVSASRSHSAAVSGWVSAFHLTR